MVAVSTAQAVVVHAFIAAGAIGMAAATERRATVVDRSYGVHNWPVEKNSVELHNTTCGYLI